MREFVNIAKTIAAKANDCCNRSDGYEEEIESLVLNNLNKA